MTFLYWYYKKQKKLNFSLAFDSLIYYNPTAIEFLISEWVRETHFFICRNRFMDILINKIKEITEDLLRFSKFRLVDIDHKQFKSKHTFTVYMDSVTSITIDECRTFSIRISEQMESSGIFGDSCVLEVSSPGIDRPIKHDWQFKKNIGRNLEIIYEGEQGAEVKQKGKLTGYQDDAVILQPVSKKKKDAVQPVTIPLAKIKIAKVQIEWN